MGGIISGIGSLFGGSSAKTDRKLQLQGYGDLQNLFNFALPTAKSGIMAGEDLLGKAGDYYSKILGGRQAATEAAAPVANAAAAQTDAAKRAIASSGTARGGGVNAVTQTLEDRKRAQVDQAIQQARGGAAAGAAKVGSTMTAQAQNLLGLGESTATNLTSIAAGSRATSAQLHRQAVADAGNLVNTALDAIFAPMGTAPGSVTIAEGY